MGKTKNKYILGLAILTILLMVMVAGCGGGEKQKETEGTEQNNQGSTEWVKELTFLAANPGGEWYPLAVAIGDIWTKNIEGINVSIQPGGGVSNVVGVGTGQGHLGLTQPAMAVFGANGEPPYKQKLPDIQALAVLYPTVEQIVVTEDSGINDISDLKGKSINVYTKGYTSEIVASMILKAYGLSYDDMGKVMYLNDSDCIDSMKDGHLDATFSMGSVPDAGFIDLGTTKKFKLLSIGDEQIKKITEENPGLVKRVIPAGSYPGIDYDVQTVGTNLMIAVNKNLPEDQVYQLTKYLAENVEKLHNVSDSLKEVTAESLAGPSGVPFHPGAEKYYKEMGYLK